MLAKPRKLIAVQWSATKLPNFPPGCLSARWQTHTPNNTTYSATCGIQRARCVSLICVIGQRIDLDRNTVSSDITVFFPTLNSAHDCLSPSTLIPFYSLFTVSALVLSPLPPPRLSHIQTNEAGCLYDS